MASMDLTLGYTENEVFNNNIPTEIIVDRR